MRTTADARYFGGARPGDKNFPDVRARTDGELVAYLEHRRRWRAVYRLAAALGRMIELARSLGGPHGAVELARGAYRNGARE